MRTALLLNIIFLLLASPAEASERGVLADSLSADTLFHITNETRASHGLAPLNADNRLNQAAQARAIAIVTSGVFSHTGPEGEPFYTWIRDVAYPFAIAGENLAKDFDNPDDLVRAWMESPTHRANLVDPGYTATGIGVAMETKGGRNITVAVQLFAAPRATVRHLREASISLPPVVKGTVQGARTVSTPQSPVLLLVMTAILAIVFIRLLEHWRSTHRLRTILI